MKLLLISALLLSSSISFSYERMQAFRRANDNEIMLEGSYTFIESRVSYTSGSTSNFDSSQTNVDLRGEFGLTENIALGTKITKSHAYGDEGLRDHNLYLKGQLEDFFYSFNYYISPGDSENDNFYSGGNHYSISAGYQLTNSFGVNALIRPEYEYEFKDDTSDLKAGTNYQVTAYYEHKLEKDVLGAFAGFLYGKARTTDGEPNGDDSRYSNLGLYYNALRYGFEFNPTYGYMKYMSFNDKTEATVTFLNLTIRKRF